VSRAQVDPDPALETRDHGGGIRRYNVTLDVFVDKGSSLRFPAREHPARL
jgi:hypothetical protein